MILWRNPDLRHFGFTAPEPLASAHPPPITPFSG